MKSYQVIENEFGSVILRLPDNACIPTDPNNSDYAEYLEYTEWVENGNDPEDFWTRKGTL